MMVLTVTTNFQYRLFPRVCSSGEDFRLHLESDIWKISHESSSSVGNNDEQKVNLNLLKKRLPGLSHPDSDEKRIIQISVL